MEKIDLFVMDNDNVSRERLTIEHVAKDWWWHISESLTSFKFNIRHIETTGDRDDYARVARQEAFTCPGTGIFVLTDNDILPYSAEQMELGVRMITDYTEFAILSSWPDPHDFRSIPLKNRRPIDSDEVLETYSCGAMRFCRKIPSLVAPYDTRKGYDGVFCRHLWDEHELRVGYMKKSRSFHLGAHCSTLWVD